MKVLLIGSNGQLGSDIVRTFQGKPDVALIGLTNKDIDVTDWAWTEKVVTSHSPDVVINTAAFIQVDRCEDEVELAFRVNAAAQKNLCRLCQTMDAAYVCFSTDYVFDGNQSTPYTEDDEPRPLNIYGISKLAGEQIVQYMLEKYYIVRVSGLYGMAGPFGKRGNFVDLIIEKAKKGDAIPVVDDQRLTPTHTRDVANALYALMRVDDYGVYHMTNAGDCTWFEFAEAIVQRCGLNVQLERAKTGTLGEKARRPLYSVLDNRHLRAVGIDELPDWQDALSDYLLAKGYPSDSGSY